MWLTVAGQFDQNIGFTVTIIKYCYNWSLLFCEICYFRVNTMMYCLYSQFIIYHLGLLSVVNCNSLFTRYSGMTIESCDWLIDCLTSLTKVRANDIVLNNKMEFIIIMVDYEFLSECSQFKSWHDSDSVLSTFIITSNSKLIIHRVEIIFRTPLTYWSCHHKYYGS